MLSSVAEDKMGWHGKVLSKDMAESVMRDIQSRILNSNKRMYPASPIEDAPPVSLRNVRMPSAPNYKPGEKVRGQGTKKRWTDGWMDYIYVLFIMFFSNRLPPVRHMGWPWPNWDVTMSEWWLWMSTPKISPTLKSLKMSIPTASLSATAQSRTW